MKAIFISLLLIVSINAQNVWYVDRDATGANTGRSWEDAWNHLDSSVWMGYNGVNWAIIGDGDTIYVSGGTDSTTYYPIFQNLYNGIRRESYEVRRTFDETVIIAPAWHEGHKGDVYFTHRNNDTYGLFLIAGVNNVKITGGFNFVEIRSNDGLDGGLIHMYGTHNTIDNCNFYSRGITPFMYFEGNHLSFTNNYFDHEENDLPHAWDLFGSGSSPNGGNHLIDGNIIIMRNGNSGSEVHRDWVQLGGDGDTTTGTFSTTIVSNNLFVDTRTEGQGYNGLFYFTNQRNSRIIIYNNIAIHQKTDAEVPTVAIWFNYHLSGAYSQSALILNNSIIMKGGGGDRIYGLNVDTVLIKNNLFVIDTTTNIVGFLIPETDYSGMYPPEYPQYKDVDYNVYARYGGVTSGNFIGCGPNLTWSQWRTGSIYESPRDVNSIGLDSRDVIFTNKLGESIEDYYTETGRGMGVNLAEEYPELVALYPRMMYDILGNPRPLTGPWDIGALQYQGGQSSMINVQGKVYLQGPFNSDSMKTSLSQNSLLPPSQPYNTQPWNYSGNEVLSLPAGQAGSGIVDWVLVELRNSSNPVEVVARRAAVLRNDGMLLEPNGVPGVRFNDIPVGSYYVAVFHRNHLAVMSAAPVQLSSNSQLYDFTNAMNKAYGTDPMKALGNGRFGMFAGDGDSNGGINIYDKNEVYDTQKGSVGYLGGDFDLDTGVTAHDVNLYWNINNGREAQLPENE